MLQVEELSAFYGIRPAVFDLSFELHPGQAVALLGRNGMGKTTTLKALLGLIQADAKMLSWNNIDMRRLSAEKRVNLGIGYVPQDQRVFPDLSVMENLQLGAGQDRQQLDGLLERFPQLTERLKHRAGVLSGGEQQMLGIVRALWGNPKLLLLDEPSEGVMPTLVVEFGKLLQGFCAQGGSILVAEQNVGWAQSWCDHALILERGQRVFFDDMKTLSDDLLTQHLAAL
jgi:branched-chain amino acid transport system ATP-binding protein